MAILISTFHDENNIHNHNLSLQGSRGRGLPGPPLAPHCVPPGLMEAPQGFKPAVCSLQLAALIRHV